MTSNLKLNLLNFIITPLFLIFLFLIIPPVFSYNWTENTKQDFEDGYFFRSTVTADGKLQIREWDDWWDTDWPQRIPVEINTTGINETLYDYQIWFITNTKALVDAGKLDPAGTAIRIAGPDGKTLIPFWIENWNVTSSTGSKIWVKVPQLLPNTKTYIYMYIRNVSTNSLSNRDAVFDLYEDWESGQIRTQTPWSATGWITSSNEGYKFEIHTSTDQLYNYTTQSTGTVSVYEGRYCVRSGTVPHNKSVYLQTTLNLTYPARIEFFWACYSESGYDWLKFYIGAAGQAQISGEKNWEFKAINLAAGSVTFKWQFERDSSGDGLYNRGFVDRIVVRKYNSILDSQIQQRVVVQQIEEWSPYYKYAEYWSNVFDTHAENAEFVYSSWTQIYNPTEHTVEIYARGSNEYFTLLSTYPSFTPNPLPNNGNPSGLMGRCRYVQYKVVFRTLGSSTPKIGDINFVYNPLPLRAYNFNGIAISSTSIMWTWTPRATYYPAIEYIDGYRIYSATRVYNKDGGYLVITSTSDGLLAELPADATYWIEENLQPNTLYQRYVVAYTTRVVPFGGNASRNIFGRDEPRGVYTLALQPMVAAERYETIDYPPYYRFVEISTQVWYSTKEFSFTSGISTGPGRLAYYRCIFSTTTSWDDAGALVWYPSSQTYLTGGGEEIIERPKLDLIATQNSSNWYFQVKSYNYDHRESGYQILGPFWFKGCPAQITDLVVTRGKGEEGRVVLSWTAPTDDMDEGNLNNARFVIKYRVAGVIDTESKFESIQPIITSTGMLQGVIELSTNVVAGQKQTYVVTGLVPGLTYWFAIRTIDSNQNKSDISTYRDPATGQIDVTKLRSRASKVARIVFDTPSYTFYAGDPSPPIRVKLVDEDGDEIKSKFGAECDLLTTSNRGSFSRDGENFGINKLYFDIGASNALFYYKDENAGSATITVDEVTARYYWNGEQGWLSEQQTHTVLPGKAVAFRVVPQDGNYNCQIVVPKKIYVEAIDKLGNTAVDFEGVAVVTTSFSGVSVVPSVVVFMSTHQGRAPVELYNNFYAGPSSFTVYELVDQDFKKLVFRDTNNGYVVGSKGMLKATSEGGRRWYTKIYGNSFAKVFNSICISGNIGIICGENGLLVRTTDNFISYTEQNIDTVGLKDSFFVTGSTIVICGDNAKVFKSTDAGVTFNSFITPVSETLNSVMFVNTSTGYFCGNNGVILKSTDTAESFIILSSGVYSNLYGMKFLNERIGYLCGSNNTLIKTVDGGETFSTIALTLDKNVTFYGIDFLSEQVGVICGSSGTVLVTINGVDFNNKSPVGFHQETFYSVKMLDYNRIIVVGSNGNILYTDNRGDSWQKVVMQGSSPQNFLWNATIISSFVVLSEEVVQGNVEVGVKNKIVKLWVQLAYPSIVTTRMNKLIVEKTGTLDDSYISAIKVTRSSVGENYYGQGSFVNGVAEISIPFELQPIGATPTTFYIFVDISKDAPLDETFGLKFNFGCITLTGVQFGRNNLPLVTSEFIVVPPVVNVYIVDIDTYVYLRKGEVQVSTTPVNFLEQGDHAVAIKLGLKTDRSKSPFRKLRVRLTGTNLRPGDIKQISLYKDQPFVDTNHLASSVFFGDFAILEFDDKNIKIDDKTTSYFYLTTEVSPQASFTREGNEVNFSFSIDISPSWFILDHKGINNITSRFSAIQTQIRSNRVKIEAARDIVTVKPLTDIMAKIPLSVYQSQRIVLLPLGVSVGKRGMGEASASWLKLQLDKTTAAADNYTRFERSSSVVSELWRDDGDGVLDLSKDIFISAATFENNTSVILFPQPESITIQTLHGFATYFVVCYVPKNAQPKEKLQFKISTGTYITLAGIDEVDTTNMPIISPEVTIEDFPDDVEVSLISLAEPEVALYEENFPMIRIDLVTFCDATLDKLTLLAEGTADPSSTIKLVKVYLDDGDRKFDRIKDIVVATGTFTQLGRCELTFFNPDNKFKYKPVLVLDEPVRLFITVDFNENAIAEKIFGIGISHEDFIYNLPNRQKSFAYFSTGKTVLMDKRTPTKPLIRPEVPLGYGIDTGLEVANVVYYISQNNQIKFNWYSETKYGSIKTGYCAISTRKPISSNDQPDVTRYKEMPTVGNFTLSGLNLEHGKLYYLWVKAENVDGGFSRVNYVPVFVDRTEPLPPQQPEINISVDTFWLNSKIVEDDESFVKEIIIEERKHQEYTWYPVQSVTIPLQDLIRQLNEGRLISTKNSLGKVIFSSRSYLSDNTTIVYTFTTSTQTKQDVEITNFNTLFAKLGYKLENIDIRIEHRFNLSQERKFRYYRVRSKNVSGLYSEASDLSNAVYSFVPDSLIIELTTFPNPCDVRKKNLTICYILSKDAEVTLRFFDLVGRQVSEKFIPFGSNFSKLGVNYFELEDSKDFAAGMYILLMEAKDKDGKVERKKWKFGIIR